MSEQPKEKVDEYMHINRQIADIWASLAQTRASLSELRQMVVDVSDGMYRRKVRPKPVDEEEDYVDKALRIAIEGLKRT